MQKVVCNIPHSGVDIPRWAWEDVLITKDELTYLLEFMTDKDVDKLWDFVPEGNRQVATVSRLVVDTERYRDDSDEPMAKKGMGLYYTHTPFGREFRRRTEGSYSKCLEIYDDYHAGLEKKVARCLEEFGECLILDCHSFHDEMGYTGYSCADFPDVCIGVNGEITRESQLIIDAFLKAGYTVKINEPFSGALVPVKYIDDHRVTSVMIELNRRIYDGDDFERVKGICRGIYKGIKVNDKTKGG